MGGTDKNQGEPVSPESDPLINERVDSYLDRLPGVDSNKGWTVSNTLLLLIYSFILLGVLGNAVESFEDSNGTGEVETENGEEIAAGADQEEDEIDPEGGEDTTDDVESLDDFEEELQLSGIEVEYLNLVGEQVHLDYQTQATTEQEESEEVRTIALAYAELVYSGYESELLDVIFMDQHGTDLGGFFIVSEWAQEYANDEISEEEYMSQVIDTFGYE